MNELARLQARGVTRCNLLNKRLTHGQLHILADSPSRILSGGFPLPQYFRDIKVYEIRVVEDPRLDRSLHFVAFMAMGGDDMHHRGRDAVLVAQGHAAEGVAEHLTKLSFDDLSPGVLVELEHLSHIRQERAGDEVIDMDRHAVTVN